MSNKEVQEFYRSLSRKELQSLCKTYGLPARKSSSEMAYSLFSYFQQKDLSLVSLDNGIGREVLLSPSSVTTLHNEASFNGTGNALKDSVQARSYSREEERKGNKSTKCNELESCVGLGTYNKGVFGSSVDYSHGASLSQFPQCAGVGFFHKEPPSSLIRSAEERPEFIGGDINLGNHPKESVPPAINSYTKAPSSFEFYVSSEEGIKLCVDFDSSPVDWIKSYQNQVSLCNNVGESKSQSIRQELGRIGENDKQMKSAFPQSVDPCQIKDGYIRAEFSPSSVMENSIVGIDHPDVGDKSLIVSSKRPCSAALLEVSDCLREDLRPISSVPSSDMQNQMVSTTGSAKHGYIAILDSDISDVQTENTACNSAINSTSNGSIDLVGIKHQNSKHNSTLQNCCNHENNCAAFPGCLPSSTDIQLSEAGNYHKGASCLPNRNCESFVMDDPKCNPGSKQDVLVTSSENDHCGNHLSTCSEELEQSNIVNVMESSVCSQVDNSVEKNLTSDNLESNEESNKKRPLMDIDGQKTCSKRDTKVLRSMKRSAVEILPRRSTRLVSK